MKHLKLTAVIASAIAFTFTACNKAVDEKTAIANFKTEVESVTKWADEKSKAASKDPMAGMSMVGEIVGKFKAIKTDGLPADLKGAWGELTTILGEMGDLFKNMPKVDASKPEDMGKVMGELMPKMMAVQAKMEPITKKLDELGKKYNIDLKKVANGGK